MRRYRLARLLQNSDGNIPCDTRKIIQKLVKGFAGLKIVEQILDRHTRAGKDRHAALDLPVNRYQLPGHGQ